VFSAATEADATGASRDRGAPARCLAVWLMNLNEATCHQPPFITIFGFAPRHGRGTDLGHVNQVPQHVEAAHVLHRDLGRAEQARLEGLQRLRHALGPPQQLRGALRQRLGARRFQPRGGRVKQARTVKQGRGGLRKGELKRAVALQGAVSNRLFQE
jgi:hypothetical protein